MTETKPSLLADACGVCGNEVLPTETIFLDETIDGGKLVFHYRCYGKWQQVKETVQDPHLPFFIKLKNRAQAIF